METTIPQSLLIQAKQLMGWMPYRLIFIAMKDGQESLVFAKHDRRLSNKLVREGWNVFQVS